MLLGSSCGSASPRWVLRRILHKLHPSTPAHRNTDDSSRALGFADGNSSPGCRTESVCPGLKGHQQKRARAVTEAETSAQLLHLIPQQHRDRLAVPQGCYSCQAVLLSAKFILN